MDLTHVKRILDIKIITRLEYAPSLLKDRESRLFIDTTGIYVPDELSMPGFNYFGNYEIDKSVTYILSYSLNIQSLTPDIVETLKFRVSTNVLRDDYVDERGYPHSPVLSSVSPNVDTIEGNVVRVKIYVLYVKVTKKETEHDLQVFFFIAKKI